MVLFSGREQVEWRKMRHFVWRLRVRMATDEEVLKITGYRVGTVSPFGLRHQVRVLIYESVLREEEISLCSGVRQMAIIMKRADVQKTLGESQVVSLLGASCHKSLHFTYKRINFSHTISHYNNQGTETQSCNTSGARVYYI